MRLGTILKGLPDVEWNGHKGLDVTRITGDSREVRRGAAFFAVKGAKADGHAFLSQAQLAGAAACVVERPPEGAFSNGMPWIRVPDTQAALHQAARIFFGDPSSRLALVGVTGTNGKTTFTYLVESILETAGRPAGVIGTVNYRVRRKVVPARNTTPGIVDLQRLLSEFAEAGARDAVMEVSSHALDQRRVDGLDFDAAVFTNLTQDHLDYHSDLRSYGLAKKRFFTEVLPSSRKKRKTAVLNTDTPLGREIAAEVSTPVTGYGWEVGDVHVRQARSEGAGLELLLGTPLGPLEVHSPLVGRHNVYNILAAVATACVLGVGKEEIRKGVARLRLVPGRMERVEHRDRTVWVDYAHTPEALRHALLVAQSVTPGQVTCVFGCGGDRDRLKRPLMGRIASLLSDRLVLTSDNARSEDPLKIIDEIRKGIGQDCRIEVIAIADRRQALVEAVRGCRAGDAVLLAGKGHEDYQIMGEKRMSFSDVAVAKEVLRAHASL
ncbi:MAG: UDP-N-acetylmuramoyl-L-alanyl-D-glutamate--2,6-diaminopimelate ligase [Nitrospirae bacterium]|nr:UDP-N-acetylmuramoyl-L-alanyl-D-glutamate--2,6-diaminopimelate ligase [Nitrospirota bacterium]